MAVVFCTCFLVCRTRGRCNNADSSTKARTKKVTLVQDILFLNFYRVQMYQRVKEMQ